MKQTRTKASYISMMVLYTKNWTTLVYQTVYAGRMIKVSCIILILMICIFDSIASRSEKRFLIITRLQKACSRNQKINQMILIFSSGSLIFDNSI